MNFLGQVVRFLLIGSFVIAHGGCAPTPSYDVELESTDEGMRRSLSYKNNGVTDENGKGAFSVVELKMLDQIAAKYGVGKVSELKDVTHEFSGVFTNQMPQDVGGRGEYRRWKTSLGHSSVYVERLRGNDDLLSRLESWNRDFDSIVDHLIAWLETELKEEVGFAELKGFMDDEFRRDVKNLGLYVMSIQFKKTGGNDLEGALVETAMRVAQYFCERGYFAIEDVPEIVRATSEYDATDRSQRLLKILQRLIASKMGVRGNQRVPDCLNFVAQEKTIFKSINDYLQTTDDYKKMVSDWEIGGKEEPKPKPTDVWNNLEWGGEIIFFGGESVRVTLKSRSQPLFTNGAWDEKSHTVKWRESVADFDSVDTSYPMLAYALWADPNEEAQVKHFGRVVLDEQPLASYCVWYHGLDESESKQWDSFLATITPNSNIESKLQAFRFKHEPPAIEGDDSNKDLVGSVRSLILNGLSVRLSRSVETQFEPVASNEEAERSS